MTQPASAPSRVPIQPTKAPCRINIFKMLKGEAPNVRRIAISPRLSLTVITSIDTKLNAATAIIKVRIINIIRFSVLTAANQVRF